GRRRLRRPRRIVAGPARGRGRDGEPPRPVEGGPCRGPCTMKAILEDFHRIGDAPDAIPRLRQFILDLAVRGKVVPQGPGGGPASERLKRIAAEKVRLVKAGVIKAERAEKARYEQTSSFDLPSGWTWASLKDLCISVTDGDHLPPPKADKGV